MNTGFLIVSVTVESNIQPVKDARVRVLNTDIETYTDLNGKSEVIELEAPSLEASNTPGEVPYSTYDIEVTKEGLVPYIIRGVEIYPNVTSTQEIVMTSRDESNQEYQELDIEPPVLVGDYSPKLPDKEEQPETPLIKPMVLPFIGVPEYIIVHDGVPSNTTASNYQVNFSDYIKNVACSEIYASWPRECIKANVIAIVSFTLNRVYTEWYRSKGYNFTITGVTAYDQKYTHGRTIFDSIANVVDEYFSTFIKFPGREEPFLAHYNDGIKLNNPGWLSQWGSKDLADKGYNALQILKYYYGNNLTLQVAPILENYPSSFPGYILKVGSCGEEVQIIQNQINTIRGNYPGIPRITNPNGEYDNETANSIRIFQNVFGLPKTGEVDYVTWYKISYIYTAVAKLTNSITT